MRVTYSSQRRVIKISSNRIKVIDVATQGPPAIPPTVYMDHMARVDNPHQVGVFQLLVPSGNNGKWIKFAEDGSALEPTRAPLVELPPLPIPPDECVRADPSDPVTGFLNSKVAGLIYVDEAEHVVRLLGVTGGSDVPPNCYYGTNDEGQLGFWPLPESLIHVSGIGTGVCAENEDEWNNTGEVALFTWP